MNNEEIYLSNLFINRDPFPLYIKIYVTPIMDGLPEYVLKRELKKLFSEGIEDAHTSVITHKKLYSCQSVIEKLKDYVISNKSRLVSISNLDENIEYAKVIGSLTYRSLDLLFMKRGFNSIKSKLERNKRIFYIPDDQFFELTVDTNIAVFKAIRGLSPKVYAGTEPGKLYLFFIPDGSHLVNVKEWKAFIGEEVKVKRAYFNQINNHNTYFSGSGILKNIKNETAIVEDFFTRETFSVPTRYIYIPATSRLLRRFNVFNSLFSFTSFQNITEYSFLENALRRFLGSSNEDKLEVKIGLTPVKFYRCIFQKVKK